MAGFPNVEYLNGLSEIDVDILVEDDIDEIEGGPEVWEDAQEDLGEEAGAEQQQQPEDDEEDDDPLDDEVLDDGVEDDGVVADVDDEIREMAFSSKFIHTNKVNINSLYCYTLALVVVYDIYGGVHRLCGECYVVYKVRIASARHQHVNTHTTGKLTDSSIFRCRSCQCRLEQINLVEVCVICNNINKKIR